LPDVQPPLFFSLFLVSLDSLSGLSGLSLLFLLLLFLRIPPVPFGFVRICLVLLGSTWFRLVPLRSCVNCRFPNDSVVLFPDACGFFLVGFVPRLLAIARARVSGFDLAHIFKLLSQLSIVGRSEKRRRQHCRLVIETRKY